MAREKSAPLASFTATAASCLEHLLNLLLWWCCHRLQVFLGSALKGDGVSDIKAWAVSKLPEGPTLYEKV